MTPAPQPQQQEYIITEEQIVRIGEAMTTWYLPDAGISLCRLLRSLPHTSTPKFTKDCMCNKYTNCTDCQQHDAEVAKKERERVLEVVDIECQEIQSRIESSAMGNPLSERERGRIIGILDIRVKLDSLRGVNHD